MDYRIVYVLTFLCVRIHTDNESAQDSFDSEKLSQTFLVLRTGFEPSDLCIRVRRSTRRSVCVCVCVQEEAWSCRLLHIAAVWQRERERERARERERERERVFFYAQATAKGHIRAKQNVLLSRVKHSDPLHAFHR